MQKILRKSYYLRRNEPVRQNIINNLNKLFSGTIDTLRITYHTPKSKDVIKFTMLGHRIMEEDGVITVQDDKDGQTIPKTVNIDSSEVEDITYEDDRADGVGIFRKKVVISMRDGGEIEMATVGM